MTNPQSAGRHLAYQVAADPRWAAAGSTRLAGGAVEAHRRATRVTGVAPYNISVYDLALNLDRDLADFVQRHGSGGVPVGRTAIAARAADLAGAGGEARDDYAVMQLVHELRAALTIGEADPILGKMVCPQCLCWSLLGTRAPSNAWAATCRNKRCATEPGVPRVWSLHKVARHHVRRDRPAA